MRSFIKLIKGQLVFIAVVLGVAVLAAFVTVRIVGTRQAQRYVAVYLETGDIYFGQMRWFPSPRLSNVMFLQQAQGQEGLMVDHFTNVVWRPQEPMRISRDKIVFWTYLDPASPIVQAIKGRAQPVGQPVSPPDTEGLLPQTDALRELPAFSPAQ